MMKTKPKINIIIDYPSRVFNKHIFDKLYDYSTFTEVHYGGASSGKSHGVIQKVVFLPRLEASTQGSILA